MSTAHGQPRAGGTSAGIAMDGDGSCQSYDQTNKFREGDGCKDVAGDYSINTNDLGESITSSYTALGDDGGNGFVAYKWSPPSELESIDLRIRGAILDDSEGSIDINLWNNDTDEWDTIRVEPNSDYNPYEYSSISLFIANDKYIDGGRFEVQLVTDDGWWIDDIRADWTEADPAISVSPGEGSYSLGELTIGESKTKSFTVENTGDATLNAEPSLTGSDTDQFSITNGQSLSLEPGEDYTYDVEYAPDEAGTHQVDFEIGHDAPNIGNPWTATLSGEGKPQLATLNLRVENVNGGSTTVPKSNGIVKLYDGNGNLIDEKTTAAVGDGTGAGEVTFEDLDPAGSYTAQIYHDSQKSALNVTEYWGKKTSISLSGGDTKNITFTRYQPYLAGLEVYDQNGTKVTGGTVEPGTPLTVKITAQNDGSAQSVQPRLVLDRDKQEDDQGNFDFDQTASSSPIATGDQETFSFDWTPEGEGDVYRTYVINGVTPSGTGATGSGGWWDQPLVTVEANEVPTASMPPSVVPSSLYPNRKYTLRAVYSDQNGANDLSTVELRLNRSSNPIKLRHNVQTGETSTLSGSSYLKSRGVSNTEKSGADFIVDWTFTLKKDWPSASGGISYQLGATDQSGAANTDGSVDIEGGVSFRDYGTTVLTHGLQSPSIDDKLSKWLIDAGCRILQAAGGGKIRIYDKSDGQFESPSEFDTGSDSFFEHADDCAADLPPTGEKIFIFHWDKDSNNLGLGYSESAASALFAALKEHEEVESELGPVHLIGHSRGTAVMSEVAERFSVIGEDVDHVTLLDPHDWGADPGKINFLNITTGELILNDYDVNPDMGIGYPDGIPYTEVMGKSVKSNGVVGWEGIGWVEAYWQRNGDDDAVASKSYSYNNCYSSFWGPELNGRPVRGAYNEEWSSFNESCPDGGSQNLNHSGIYREYIRSIEGSATAPGGYEYSRIGGYVHDRPSRTDDGNPLSAEFSFANLGRGIINGDFVRGAEIGGDPVCEQPEGCIPGWTHHGGGGTDGSGRAELVNSENDRALVLGYTEFQYDDDTYVTNSPPAKSLRRTDRFYIPERANRIELQYKINHPPETGPVLGGGAESPDQYRIDIGQKGNFTQVFQASESEGPHDTFQTAQIPLTSDQRGSVQQLRLRVTNDDGKVGSAVLIDNVRIGVGENQLPVAEDDNDQTTEGQSVTNDVLANDSDPDGDLALSSVQVESGPSNGTATANADGTIGYTPDDGFTGTDSYTYTVADNDGARSGEATVTVEVKAPGDLSPIAPVASSPQQAGSEFWIDIRVGSESNNVQNLNQVGFDLGFEQQRLNHVDDEAGSFLEDVQYSSSVDEGNGIVEVGVTRTDDEGRSGSGVVARIKLAVGQDVAGGTELTFSLQNVQAEDSGGNSIDLNPQDLDVIVQSGITVWPGDMDDNEEVDQFDIFPLGDYWGETGPPRAEEDQGCEWRATTAQLQASGETWATEEAIHADANGDGEVDQFDVFCIGDNWGKTQSSGAAATASPTASATGSTAGEGVPSRPGPSRLVLDVSDADGGAVWLRIKAREVENLLGFGGELAYPAEDWEVQRVEPAAWLGEDLLTQTRVEGESGRVGIAISRKGTGRSGSGPVVRLKLRPSADAAVPSALLDEVQLVDPAGRTAEGQPVEFQTEKSASPEPPEQLVLEGGHPNPVRGSATIEYGLPDDQHVRLVVYDILGRRVATLVDQRQTGGRKTAPLDVSAEGISSGTYLLRLTADGQTKTSRITVVR
ncbi:pimeloyl-ACP methyl ester carboxylesterase [Salinibacter ruber]|nr:pimeloyl-ACP methyl ester carboxylesterase [Salinibacter ruber]